MLNSEFKRFKEILSTANENHYIWNMGFLWIDLTKKQASEIVKILSPKPFIKHVNVNGHDAIEIPSGLAIWKEQ